MPRHWHAIVKAAETGEVGYDKVLPSLRAAQSAMFHEHALTFGDAAELYYGYPITRGFYIYQITVCAQPGCAAPEQGWD